MFFKTLFNFLPMTIKIKKGTKLCVKYCLDIDSKSTFPGVSIFMSYLLNSTNSSFRIHSVGNSNQQYVLERQGNVMAGFS